MEGTWISTTDLLKRIEMSRSQLDRLRQGDDRVFVPGDHFIAKGVGPRAGFLWNVDNVIGTLAQLAKQNELSHAKTDDELRS